MDCPKLCKQQLALSIVDKSRCKASKLSLQAAVYQWSLIEPIEPTSLNNNPDFVVWTETNWLREKREKNQVVSCAQSNYKLFCKVSLSYLVVLVSFKYLD